MHEATSFRTVLQTVAVSVVAICALGYVLFQARYMIIGPQIVLNAQPDLLHNERRIELAGSAYNISRLWLNDRPIYTDAQGNFEEALVLENGYTVATLRAEDRYGRETTVATPFVYYPMNFIQ